MGAGTSGTADATAAGAGGNAIETLGVGKRYRGTWALRDCTLAVPAGRVVGLVGPNGAGKSTLLNMSVGLCTPSAGEISVFGGLRPGSPEALERISFVAQDAPLYPNLSVADTLRLVSSLSRRWDGANARARLDNLGIALKQKVGKLSGGQQSQVALAVALARRPEFVILDEPVARLDPVARHEFMAVLMSAAAEDGLSVLLSSHVVSELERVCDYLVVLSGGRVQVIGDVADLLATHATLTGPTSDAADAERDWDVVFADCAARETTLVVRVKDRPTPPPGWRLDEINLEDLALAYLRTPPARALPTPVPPARRMAS